MLSLLCVPSFMGAHSSPSGLAPVTVHGAHSAWDSVELSVELGRPRGDVGLGLSGGCGHGGESGR